MIAPDTPGYGLSPPLAPPAPSAADFADAFAAFLDALGLERVAVYGAHTGADLAMALAGRFPGRVTASALDGVSAFTPDEVRSFEADYLVPYKPDWEGRHVMALWSRVKDAVVWFPWHDRTAARRLATEPAALEVLDRKALGFIQAGPHYAKAYRVSAAFDPNHGLRSVQAPTTIFARPTDLLRGHLSRLDKDGPWLVRTLSISGRAWLDTIAEAISLGAEADVIKSAAEPTSAGPRLIANGDGYLEARWDGSPGGEVRVLLADLPGSSALLLESERKRHPNALLITLDAPGCGGSDPMVNLTLQGVIDMLELALTRLAVVPDVIVGEGAASALAALLGPRVGARVEAIRAPAWLRDPARQPATKLLGPLTPKWDGSHLTGAWFQLRDLALYDIPPGRGGPSRRIDSLDIEELDARFRSFVGGPEAGMLLDQLVQLSDQHDGLMDGVLYR